MHKYKFTGYGSFNFSAQIYLTKSASLFLFSSEDTSLLAEKQRIHTLFLCDRLFSRLAGSQGFQKPVTTKGVKPGTGIAGPAESEEHDNLSVTLYRTPTVQ